MSFMSFFENFVVCGNYFKFKNLPHSATRWKEKWWVKNKNHKQWETINFKSIRRVTLLMWLTRLNWTTWILYLRMIRITSSYHPKIKHMWQLRLYNSWASLGKESRRHRVVKSRPSVCHYSSKLHLHQRFCHRDRYETPQPCQLLFTKALLTGLLMPT